jgi:hypothetical protein
MPNTDRLLEQVRRVVPRHTDYAIAKALGMHQSDLLRVFAGKQGLGLKAAIRISELLQRDFRDIVVLIEEDKATRPKDVEFWGARSPRITASILTAILGIAVTVGPTKGHTMDAADTGYPNSIGVTYLYIMRTLKRWLLLTFGAKYGFRIA